MAASTTIGAPASHSQLVTDYGRSYDFSAMLELEQAFADRLDPLSAGLVMLKGDAAGTGSDVIRVTIVDGLGYDAAMSSLASETDTPTALTWSSGYDTVTVSEYGLAYEETYRSQILSRAAVRAGVSLDALKARLPENYGATVRSLVASTIAGMATDVGSKSTSLSVDDILDLTAAAIETLGATGEINAMVYPVQFTQLRSSAANHPAFQGNAADFTASQRFILGQQSYVNYAGLGVNFHLTDDVATSGGGYDGAAWTTGAVGYGIASLAGLRLNNPVGAVVLSDRGIYCEEILDGSNQRTRRFNAIANLGVALGDATVYFQRGLVSTT